MYIVTLCVYCSVHKHIIFKSHHTLCYTSIMLALVQFHVVYGTAKCSYAVDPHVNIIRICVTIIVIKIQVDTVFR